MTGLRTCCNTVPNSCPGFSSDALAMLVQQPSCALEYELSQPLTWSFRIVVFRGCRLSHEMCKNRFKGRDQVGSWRRLPGAPARAGLLSLTLNLEGVQGGCASGRLTSLERATSWQPDRSTCCDTLNFIFFKMLNPF